MAEQWSWCCGEAPDEPSAHARRLDAFGWGAFFVWVGIAALADVGLGIGLLGVGLITLGCQVLRRMATLPWEGFWVVVGVLFLLGGIWQVAGIQVDLLPLLLITAGVLLFVSAFRRRPVKSPSGHEATHHDQTTA